MGKPTGFLEQQREFQANAIQKNASTITMKLIR
jgi:hypothetical protein